VLEFILNCDILCIGWSFRAKCYVRLSNLWLACCRGIQSATEVLSLKRGDILHIVLTALPYGGYASCWRTCFLMSVCLDLRPSVPSVRPAHAGILSKQINISSNFSHRLVATPFEFICTKRYGDIPTGTPAPSLTETSNETGAWKKSRFSTNISLYLGNDTR